MTSCTLILIHILNLNVWSNTSTIEAKIFGFYHRKSKGSCHFLHFFITLIHVKKNVKETHALLHWSHNVCIHVCSFHIGLVVLQCLVKKITFGLIKGVYINWLSAHIFILFFFFLCIFCSGSCTCIEAKLGVLKNWM